MSPCRCLLRDMPEAAVLAKRLREWVEALPEDTRADDDTVRARLTLCEACDSLADGTCVRCGCYTEFRAAQRMQSCPVKKW